MRLGDQYYPHFERAVRSVSGGQDISNAADEALQTLAAAGHDFVPEPRSIADRPCIDRMTMLAWRSIDEQQERFAQAAVNRDPASMREAARHAASFVALLDRLRDNVQSPMRSQLP